MEDDDLWLEIRVNQAPEWLQDVGPEKKGTTPSAETPEHFRVLDETAAQPSRAVGDDVWLADEDVLADRGPFWATQRRGAQAATDGATQFAFLNQEGAARKRPRLPAAHSKTSSRPFSTKRRANFIALQGYVHGLAAEPDNAGLAGLSSAFTTR